MKEFDPDPSSSRRPLDDDGVETLLRETGRRPPIPADRAQRVKGIVRAHWRAEVERRSARRGRWSITAFAAAASVAIVIGLVWQRPGLPPTPDAAARVEAVVATVQIAPSSAAPEGTTVLRRGDAIPQDSRLITPLGGLLAVRMGSGHSLRLDSETRLRVLAADSVALDQGTVYVDSRGAGKLHGASLEIRTRLGTIRDIGTQFEARLRGDSLRIRVREGSVSVLGADRRLEVGAGEQLELDREGLAVRGVSAAFGGDWSWIGRITPMLDLEGRTLREFLDWMARERGLQLEFASPALAVSASEIELNGSIEGMTLDQALTSVLATCRMEHRVGDGRLFVLRSSVTPASIERRGV